MKKFLLWEMIAIFLLCVAGLYVLMATPAGGLWLTRRVVSSYAEKPKIDMSGVEGNLLQGLELNKVKLQEFKNLPEGTVLKIQRFFFDITALSLSAVVLEIENTRLFFPESDPIVVNGSFRDAMLDFNIFAHGISVGHVMEMFGKAGDPVPLGGTVESLDIYIKGKAERPKVTGEFHIKSLDYQGSMLKDCEGSFDLAVESGREVQLFGLVRISKGVAATPKASIKLEESRIEFSGPVDSLYMKIKGSTRIEGVKIDIAVEGTKDKPNVELTSVPSFPKETLLLMVATGKRWRGLEKSFDQQTLSPDLTVDFVDYFLFGGSGRRIVQYFGLSDFALKYDEDSKGVMVKKDVTDKLGVGYGVEEKQQKEGVANKIKQVVEGEYQMTDRLSVGVQKEIQQPNEPTGTDAGEPPPIPDDRVYMKYKLKF